jgi:dihydrolipoamide dehydrogenase
VVIVGGGPGGYEAALVAAQLGAETTVVDRDGLGGSAVLTDCVPSKTLIATAEVVSAAAESAGLGVRFSGDVGVDLAAVNARVKRLAAKQSSDVADRLAREGVRIVKGTGCLTGADSVVATLADGGEEQLEADAVLVATGARPRVLAAPSRRRADPDLDPALRPRGHARAAVVVGSGVTGGGVRVGLQRAGQRRGARLQP